MAWRRYWPALLLVAAFLLAYVPDVGHGFISDDFRWIQSAEDSLHSPQRFFTETTGFFRPLVTLSFGVNWLMFGQAAFGYGVTNLLLALACAALIYVVCRAEDLSPAASLVAAGAWTFNFHGINMATLWISGRTSLLLTLFALLAAHATLRRKPWHAAVWCLAALVSKEEAIALPLILAVWGVLPAAAPPTAAVTWTGLPAVALAKAGALWPALLPLGAYFAARTATDAFWPSTAPDYYRFTFDPWAIATNVAHYVDRACTTAAIVAVVLTISSARRPRWQPWLGRAALHGLVWLVGGYAITVWLPVRSSLYAVFPSVGAMLILATFADALWSVLDARRRRRAAAALVVLPFLLNPVYRSRNIRWVELADLTREALVDIAPHVPALKAGGRLIVADATSRANVRNAFGSHLPDAIDLVYGVRPEVELIATEAPRGPTADPRRPTFFVRAPAAP